MEWRRRFRRWRRRRLVHPLQGLLAYALYGLLRPLPIAWTSGLGAVMGRSAGLVLPSASARTGANLRRLDPGFDDRTIARQTGALWDHLGRTFAEYAVLDRLWGAGRIEVVGVESAMEAVGGRPMIFFGGHLGNWELAPAAAVRLGYPVGVIVRAPSNRVVAGLLERIRRRCGITLLPKTVAGTKAGLDGLRRGRPLGFLVDEKTVRGVPVPSLGRGTTGQAIVIVNLVRFALKSGAVLVPIRVRRLDGARFRLHCHRPIVPDGTADPLVETARLVGEIDALLGSWVRETPTQWLWLTQRL